MLTWCGSSLVPLGPDLMSVGLGLELRQEITGTYKNVLLLEEQNGDGRGPDALCLR